jgi:MOSC domain-containing protein YiiM
MGDARIVQISVSPGGVPKRAVEAARVTTLGLEGDGHRFPEEHGGPERALCLFSLEVIERLREEGHPIAPGTIGENLTLEGIDWRAVVPGTRLALGTEVVAEVTRFTTPCRTIAASFVGNTYSRVSHVRHPGWSRVYARVLREGTLHRGDGVRIA